MGLNRYRAFLLAMLSGGMLLQTTASCEETIAPALANLAVSAALEILLGGLAT